MHDAVAVRKRLHEIVDELRGVRRALQGPRFERRADEGRRDFRFLRVNDSRRKGDGHCTHNQFHISAPHDVDVQRRTSNQHDERRTSNDERINAEPT